MPTRPCLEKVSPYLLDERARANKKTAVGLHKRGHHLKAFPSS